MPSLRHGFGKLEIELSKLVQVTMNLHGPASNGDVRVHQVSVVERPHQTISVDALRAEGRRQGREHAGVHGSEGFRDFHGGRSGGYRAADLQVPRADLYELEAKSENTKNKSDFASHEKRTG